MKSLKGHFLVAAPSLTESNFRQTVVLMLQHDHNGALGVVINRRMEVTVKQACEQVLETECDVEGNLHSGGPCEAVLMVLHGDDDINPDDEAVLPGLHFSTDKDTIEMLLREPPKELKFIVGYSGWAGGQLEEELKSGSWIVVPATVPRVFGPIESLWHRLISEASLSQWIDPKLIPDDPSLN
jgi:putative transcriptional regulator